MIRSHRLTRGSRRTLAWVAAAAIGLAVSGSPAFAGEQPPASPWALVDLPGGLAGLTRVLGPSLDASRVFVEAARRVDSPDEDEAGPRGALRTYMANVGESPGRAPAPVDRVPLPMSEETWQRVVFEGRPRGGLARAVITDRRASLLAHGLASLDPPMLAWFTSQPDLLRQIYRDHAGSFAVFGRSLRVERGRVAPAGGDRARRPWERLVGVPTGEPDRFFAALLDRHEGRLAWLYDTVAHLDAPHVEHLLGSPSGDDADPGQLEILARVFVDVDQGIWKVEERPFRRPSPDPALFLSEMAIDGRGDVLSPLSRAGWEAVLDGRATFDAPAPAAGVRADAATRVDLAWLTRQAFAVAPRVANDRCRTMLFAQRVFGAAPAGAATDVVTALEGHLAFPALALTLERMGLNDPALHATGARVAARLSAVGDDADRYRLLMQFQGALALVWRLHALGAVDADTTHRLVSGLFALHIDPKNRYAGGVARWMRADLMAALGAGPGAADVEEALVAALSGSVAAPPRGDGPATRPVAVEWEGLRYVLDLAGADARALRATRDAQGGYSVDQALALAGAGEVLTTAPNLARVSEQRAALAAIGDRLPPIRRAAGVAPGLAIEPAKIVGDAVADLDRAREAGDLGRARHVAATLVDLGDAVLADVLAAWAYAVAALGTDDPGLQTITLVRRHDLSPRNDLDPERRRGPWRMPRPVPVFDVPWHIGGALLALDFAMAESRLRRIEADTLPSPLTADDNLRFVLAQHVVLLEARRLTDEGRDAIVSAVSRGRARVEAIADGREDVDVLARAAGLSEWRREGIRWRAATDSGSVAEAFSLGELLRLGLAGGAAEADLVGPWGPSEEPRSGALRARWPAPAPWESLVGHRGTGMVATAFTDLVVRVALALGRAGLPAALAPAVLAGATWDLCADVQLASSDDWMALVARARAIPDARFDDYVATLTGEGPLAPADGDEALEP